jgi:hypothetical protein
VRIRRPFAALLLATGLVVVPVVPAAACACGGVAPQPGSEVSVGQEHAIVSSADGVEQIDLLLGMLSAETETGLVFPTPTPATVSLGDLADFEALDRVTTPTRVDVYDWWSVPGAGGASAGAAPEVLDRVQLGPIEAVTLAASDTEGLATWLAENDYGLAPEVEALLGGYVDRGWFFVALKVTGDAPLDGDLDPLRFRFATDELVYPMELSRAATTPQAVRLYVFADHRQHVTFAGAGDPASSFVTWAGPVAHTDVARFGDYLTVTELYFSEPSTQILGDLAFRDALSDETTGTEYRVSVPVAVLGIPAGWILTLLALAAVAGVVLVVGAVGAKRS